MTAYTAKHCNNTQRRRTRGWSAPRPSAADDAFVDSRRANNRVPALPAVLLLRHRLGSPLPRA